MRGCEPGTREDMASTGCPFRLSRLRPGWAQTSRKSSEGLIRRKSRSRCGSSCGGISNQDRAHAFKKSTRPPGASTTMPSSVASAEPSPSAGFREAAGGYAADRRSAPYTRRPSASPPTNNAKPRFRAGKHGFQPFELPAYPNGGPPRPPRRSRGCRKTVVDRRRSLPPIMSSAGYAQCAPPRLGASIYPRPRSTKL